MLLGRRVLTKGSQHRGSFLAEIRLLLCPPIRPDVDAHGLQENTAGMIIPSCHRRDSGCCITQNECRHLTKIMWIYIILDRHCIASSTNSQHTRMSPLPKTFCKLSAGLRRLQLKSRHLKLVHRTTPRLSSLALLRSDMDTVSIETVILLSCSFRFRYGSV